jgi:hypothetical protein
MDLHKKIIPFVTFCIVANPSTYKLTRKIGGWVASPDGLPTMAGLVLHAIVFVILCHFLWNLFMVKSSGYKIMNKPSVSKFSVPDDEPPGDSWR